MYFAFVKAQQIDSHFACPICCKDGKEPDLVVVDGTAHAFNRKRITPTLRPPTYTNRDDPDWPRQPAPRSSTTDLAPIEQSMKKYRDFLKRLVPSKGDELKPLSEAELAALTVALPEVAGVVGLLEVETLDPGYRKLVGRLLKQVSRARWSPRFSPIKSQRP